MYTAINAANVSLPSRSMSTTVDLFTAAASAIAAKILWASSHDQQTPVPKIYLDRSKLDGNVRLILVISGRTYYEAYVALCRSACDNVRPFTDDLPMDTWFPSTLSDGQQRRTRAALGQCGISMASQDRIIQAGEPWGFSAICLPDTWQKSDVFAELEKIVLASDEPDYFNGAPEKWILYPFDES